MKKNRKGQEESMGFIVIVLIIIIVGVVFLGFSLRKNKTTIQQQQQLADFTWATLSYTTNCSINGRQQDIWHLIEACDTNAICSPSSQNACSVLNSTLKDILDKLIGKDASLADKYIHAYSFNISSPHNPRMIRLSQGNRSGSFFSYSTFIPENITINIRMYYR